MLMRYRALGCLMWMLLVLLFSSCGYKFTQLGGVVPEGARTIAIQAFTNGTYEPYVDLEVTRAVVDEFVADGRLKVVSLESADLVLTGKVTHYDAVPQSYTAGSYVQQFMISILVNVTVMDARSQKKLMQESGLRSVFVSSYPVAIGNITATKTVKEAAIKKASQDIAWTLRSRVLEGF
jgi:hypothetical protein